MRMSKRMIGRRWYFQTSYRVHLRYKSPSLTALATAAVEL
jgi:hypothetical protein